MQWHENYINFRTRVASDLLGRRIDTHTIIKDLQGCNFSSMLNPSLQSLFKRTMRLGSDNYPEIVGKIFLVNVPTIFPFIWAMIKGWIDEGTRQKFNILTSSYVKEALLKEIDEDQLPKFLGGTCVCDVPGGCLYSDKGPWKDYEPLYPFGCRLKIKNERQSNL